MPRKQVPSSSKNGDEDGDKDANQAGQSKLVDSNEAAKKSGKKKSAPEMNSKPDTDALDSEPDYEKNKRRNSLADSPMTELSPSSSTSNGDSADDGGGESVECCKTEPISTNSSTSMSGMYAMNSTTSETLVNLEETENVDAMEKEYVHEILVGTKKLIKKLTYNKWTEALCQSIITGNFYGFLRRFKMVMLCLRKRSPQQYSKYNNRQLAAHVAQCIFLRFIDMEEQTTILMLLLTNHGDKNCAQHGHGFCRIAHMLLDCLPKSERNNLAGIAAKRSAKTVLHLAVATGHSCQLRVLLALTDVNPNKTDKSGRAPIHYAVERNNLDMVKMLMWYGADISMVQSGNSKYDSVYLSVLANPGAKANHWLQERLKAISNKMCGFAREFTAKHFSVSKELSTVHFIRIRDIRRSPVECQLNLFPKPKNLNKSISTQSAASSSHNSPKPKPSQMRAILFMVPIVFREIDELSAASDPKIVRVKFPPGFGIIGQPLIDRPNDIAHKLQLVFDPPRNRFFYAFELPNSLEGLHRICFRLGMNYSFNSEDIIIAMQAFLYPQVDKTKSKTD